MPNDLDDRKAKQHVAPLRAIGNAELPSFCGVSAIMSEPDYRVSLLRYDDHAEGIWIDPYSG
jgi:hypothetical protein